jgi:hypothetical protein
MTTYWTPWRQNPKVHDPVHRGSPPCLILSQLNPLHTLQPISFGSILTPFFGLLLGLSCGLFPSRYSTETLYTFLSPRRATCPTHHIRLVFFCLTTLVDEYKTPNLFVEQFPAFSCSFCLHSQDYGFVYFNIYIARHEAGTQKTLNGITETICVTGIIFITEWLLSAAQPHGMRATSCRVSATAYSLYCQLPSISEGRLPCPQSDDAAFRGQETN